MGACATKPKVDGGKAPEPEPAPAPEKKVEEKDVDAVVAVEPEKKVEVSVEEVAVEGNQSDKGKEVVVDDDKVDDQSVKRRSLSHLFKEVFRCLFVFDFVSIFFRLSIVNQSLSFC